LGWIRYFSLLDCSTNQEALEPLACVEALCLACDLHKAYIHVSYDYANVIKEIQAKLSFTAHCMVMKEISARREEFQQVVFRHERREANG
jgi:hypothetical protein